VEQLADELVAAVERTLCQTAGGGLAGMAVTAALDIIVPGARSVPAHADVETITVDGIGHLGMLISRRVVGYIVAALPAHGSPVAGKPHVRRLPTAAGQAATAS
jgi:hypothetical protein